MPLITGIICDFILNCQVSVLSKSPPPSLLRALWASSVYRTNGAGRTSLAAVIKGSLLIHVLVVVGVVLTTSRRVDSTIYHNRCWQATPRANDTVDETWARNVDWQALKSRRNFTNIRELNLKLNTVSSFHNNLLNCYGKAALNLFMLTLSI